MSKFKVGDKVRPNREMLKKASYKDDWKLNIFAGVTISPKTMWEVLETPQSRGMFYYVKEGFLFLEEELEKVVDK